jgi:hypothetical protein
MGAPEEPQRRYHQHGPAPRRQRWEVIVGKGEPWSKQIHDWQQEPSRNYDEHERFLHRINFPDRHFVAFHALLEYAADNHINYETYEKENIPRVLSHNASMLVVAAANDAPHLPPPGAEVGRKDDARIVPNCRTKSAGGG